MINEKFDQLHANLDFVTDMPLNINECFKLPQQLKMSLDWVKKKKAMFKLGILHLYFGFSS